MSNYVVPTILPLPLARPKMLKNIGRHRNSLQPMRWASMHSRGPMFFLLGTVGGCCVIQIFVVPQHVPNSISLCPTCFAQCHPLGTNIVGQYWDLHGSMFGQSFFFSFNFVMQPKWHSSIDDLAKFGDQKIWKLTNLSSFYIFCYVLELRTEFGD